MCPGKHRNLILSLVFLTISIQLTLAQNRPIIAIIPIRSLGGIADIEANTLTDLLETGLVKSEMFQVVEKSELSEVLAAQEYTLKEYTDENFAIEVGKLITAEQIVLGRVSKIGTKYFLTAKIIDVATGKTLKADKIEAETIELLATQTEILGLRLAGFSPSQTNVLEHVQKYGELLITTEPDNAEIYVNGLFKGKSPLLVERIPWGNIHIKAKAENMYGFKEIMLMQADLLKLKITLNQRLGRLFIRSGEQGLLVILDDEILGFIGEGLFPDLPEGDHNLVLSGNGLYSQSKITIRPEETTIVDAELLEVGSLHYDIPDGASGLITGEGFEKKIQAMGVFDNVPVGSYRFLVEHPDFHVFEKSINVFRGRITKISPVLVPTREYQHKLDQQELEKKISELLLRRNNLEADFLEAQIKHKKVVTAGLVFFGIGGTFALGTGTLFILNLTAPDEDRRQLYRRLGISCSIAAALNTIIGTIFVLEKPDLETLQEDIKDVETRIEALRKKR